MCIGPMRVVDDAGQDVLIRPNKQRELLAVVKMWPLPSRSPQEARTPFSHLVASSIAGTWTRVQRGGTWSRRGLQVLLNIDIDSW